MPPQNLKTLHSALEARGKVAGTERALKGVAASAVAQGSALYQVGRAALAVFVIGLFLVPIVLILVLVRDIKNIVDTLTFGLLDIDLIRSTRRRSRAVRDNRRDNMSNALRRVIAVSGSVKNLEAPVIYQNRHAVLARFLAIIGKAGEAVAAVSGSVSPLSVASPTAAGSGDGLRYEYPALRLLTEKTAAGSGGMTEVTLTYDTPLGLAQTDTFELHTPVEEDGSFWILPVVRRSSRAWHSSYYINAGKDWVTTPDHTDPPASTISVAFTGSNRTFTATVVTSHNSLVESALREIFGILPTGVR